MKFFNNKLSRVNFLILISILAYLYINMSNVDSYVEAISKASPSVININSKNIETRMLRGNLQKSLLAQEL